MQTIKCIIIEDEPLAVKIVKDYIEEIPFLQLCGTFRNTTSASTFLQQNKIALIFLDIHLPGLKGLDFLRTLMKPPLIIVTTAYHHYAVEGFELNIVDYLLKPIAFPRFLIAVNKVSKLLSAAPVINKDAGQNSGSVYLTIQRKQVKISFDDILYVESRKEYIHVVTLSNSFISKIRTNEMAQNLPGNMFVRIHRSFIISISKIDSFTKESVDINGVNIPIGKSYKKEFEELVATLRRG